MNYRRIVEIPEHITSSFFELPCVLSANKVEGANDVFYYLRDVKNYENKKDRAIVFANGALAEDCGALAEDYKGQWWYLTKEEFEDYVEECGLARESLMP